MGEKREEGVVGEEILRMEFGLKVSEGSVGEGVVSLHWRDGLVVWKGRRKR